MDEDGCFVHGKILDYGHLLPYRILKPADY